MHMKALVIFLNLGQVSPFILPNPSPWIPKGTCYLASKVHGSSQRQ